MFCYVESLLIIIYFLSRCSPPEKSNEYQKIYSNWCHEFEKYKTAMKTWERKQEVTILSWSFFLFNHMVVELCSTNEFIFFFSNAQDKMTRIRTHIQTKSCDSFWTSPISCFSLLIIMQELYRYLTSRLAWSTSIYSREEIRQYHPLHYDLIVSP